MLLVAGIHDAQISAERVRQLYEDLGSDNKILIDLGCASHNAMWESKPLAAVRCISRVAQGRYRE